MKLTFEGTNEEFNNFIARLVTDVEEIDFGEITENPKSEDDVKEIPSVKKSNIDIYPPQPKYFWVDIVGEIVSVGDKGILIRPNGLPSLTFPILVTENWLLEFLGQYCHYELHCRAALVNNNNSSCRLEIWDNSENQIEIRKYE